MHIAVEAHHECAIGDDLVANMQVFAVDLATSCEAKELQADTVAEAGVEDLEFGFPGFEGDTPRIFQRD